MRFNPNRLANLPLATRQGVPEKRWQVASWQVAAPSPLVVRFQAASPKEVAANVQSALTDTLLVSNIRAMRFILFVLLMAVCPLVLWGQMPPAQVILAPVQQRNLTLERSLVASVEPVTRVKVAAEQDGLVQRRHFDEGQKVEQGAVLVELDRQLLEADLEAATAAVAAAKAAVRGTEAELTNAEEELSRLRQLRQGSATTVKEVRDAQTRQLALTSLLLQHQAEVRRNEALQRRISTALAKMIVRSPISGVVVKRWVEQGEWVQQGATVAEMLQLNPLFIRVNVPGRLVGELKQGQQVQLILESEGRQISGTLEQILPEGDPASRTFPVKIQVGNADGRILPGLYARVSLEILSGDNAYVVPRDAVVTEGASSHVVAMREGKAQIVPVKLGAFTGSVVAIEGELRPEDQLVVRGNEALRGGEVLIPMNSGLQAPPQTEPAGETPAPSTAAN